MKPKDIGVIAVVAIVSSVISIFLSGAIISTPKDRQQKAEKIEPISSDFQILGAEYFNQQSLNPSQNVLPTADPESNPFGGQ